MIGLFTEPVPVDFFRLFAQEKSILASCAYTGGEMSEAVALLGGGGVAWEPIVSGTISLNDALAEGFEASPEASSRRVKLMVDPRG